MRLPVTIFLTVISTVIAARSEDWYAIWDRAGDTWYQKWSNVLNTSDVLPSDLRMELLGKAVALGTDPGMSDEKREIFTRAQSMMLAIPGHAEYYAKLFEDERTKAVLENEKRAAYGSGPWWEGYDRVRKSGFQTLRQLPSPETVRVLGEMLYDERDYQSKEFREANRELARSIGTNAGVAAGVLSQLRIAVSSEATPGNKVVFRPKEFWRVWYEQVKSGTRTFHFEGDPQEYNLQGPVSVAKSPVTEREAKERTGARKSSGVHGKSVTTSGNPAATSFIPWIVASLILILSVGYYLRRRTKQPAG